MLTRANLRVSALLAFALPIAAQDGRADDGASAGDTATPLTTVTETESHLSGSIAAELMWLRAERIIITSASRHEEELFKASAAVHVVTADDIRRSGAQTFSDVLRLVPGMSVAQMDANKSAITTRGFNSRFADKLLVLIDGRSVYTPSFSGVFWDVQDYALADVERIEVIRGPGGTLWGANAVNGVVNIITKSATDTQGSVVSGGYGSYQRGTGVLRHGAPLGESGHVRGYFKYREIDHSPEGGFDRWDFLQGGFRADWQVNHTSIVVQGDAYSGGERQEQVTGRLPAIPFSGTVIDTVRERFDVDGQNILVRVDRDLGTDSNWQLQAYWDRTNRTEIVMDGYRNTFDLDFQQRFTIAGRNDVTYGVGYRFMPDRFRNPDPGFMVWNPAERNWQLFSGFVQDEIAVVEDRLRLTLGSKFEHNDATGFEYQPNIRVAVTPNDQNTIWGAVSRAVQVPARNLDGIESIVIPTLDAAPLVVIGSGSRGVESTELIAYEIGHRWLPKDDLSTDVSFFYNEYDRLVDGMLTVDLAAGTVTSAAINAGDGSSSYGGELSVVWRGSDAWRLTGSYSYVKVDILELANALFAEGRDPTHQASLRASINLPANVDFDLMGRYTDELPSYGISDRVEVDARLGWRPVKDLRVDIIGRNLTEPDHAEFGEDQFVETLVNPVPRSVFVEATVGF